MTDEDRLRINDANVIEEHKIIANKIPNDAIRINRDLARNAAWARRR